jgi:CheY-like chemotaxis protein
MNAPGQSTSAASPAASQQSPSAQPDKASPNGAGSSPGKGRKILVVDDNVIFLKGMETKLKGLGYQVVLVKETSLAVSTARQHQPDLIILDMNFPPDDTFTTMLWTGLSVLIWLKRFQEVADIPILVVSGDDPAKHKEEVLAAGAAGYFQKPLDFNALAAALAPMPKRERTEPLDQES